MKRQTAGIIACVSAVSIALMAASPSDEDAFDDPPVITADESEELVLRDRLDVFRIRREAKDELLRQLVRGELGLADAVRETIRIHEAHPIELYDAEPILMSTGSYGEKLAELYMTVVVFETSDERHWTEIGFRDLDRCEVVHRICTEYDALRDSGELADIQAPARSRIVPADSNFADAD